MEIIRRTQGIDFKAKNSSLMGSVELMLKDADSGKVKEVIKQKNMFTNALDSLFNKSCFNIANVVASAPATLGGYSGFPTQTPVIKKALGGITEISLADTARIGYNTTYAHTSPIDANNYIDVNDTTVTLKRNSNQYAIYFFTPILEQGKKYVLMADSYTNTDGVRYWLKGSDIVSDPFQMTSISSHSGILGLPFVADGNYSYGIMTWANNTNDIVIENPRLICLDD